MVGVNRSWCLAKHPEADENIGPKHFHFEESAVPVPKDGEFLVRTIALGTSPAQRSYVTRGLSMHEKLAIGDIMRGRGVGVIEDSRHPNFRVGEIIVASTGWQDYSIQAPDRQNPNVLSLMRVKNPVYPLTTALGILGSAGATAYFGLLDVGKAKAGDTVVVSAAAGGIGSVVGQIARNMGCRVIGIAGGPKKCAWATDSLGYDVAIDYKAEDVGARLGKLCPDGMDVFFDNVGGEILEMALANLALHARVVICGFISTEIQNGPLTGPVNYRNLVRRRARMEGFYVFDYRDRFEEAEAKLRAWYNDGQLRPTEDVDEGLEHMPNTLASLFTGDNMGIKLCRVSPDP